jgi:hypothetical protein
MNLKEFFFPEQDRKLTAIGMEQIAFVFNILTIYMYLPTICIEKS